MSTTRSFMQNNPAFRRYCKENYIVPSKKNAVEFMRRMKADKEAMIYNFYGA